MKMNLVYVLMFLAIGIVSCKKERGRENDKVTDKGSVQLSLGLSQQAVLKSASANEIPVALIVTITDLNNKVIVESQRVALINMNSSYISEPIALVTGAYKIEKFIVINGSGSAIYACPLENSKLAYLVKTPLPLEFIITKDSVTKIVPEVLSVSSAQFEDFGYNSFSLDIVNTFDFLTTVMVYNENSQNWELTTAEIVIMVADSTVVYSGSLASVTNQITLRDDSTTFSIIVDKNGYQTYTVDMSAEDMKLYTSENKGPFIIKLLSTSSTVKDIDGNVYHTVKIGEQVWMMENLKTIHYRNGDPVTNISSNSSWLTCTSGAYRNYNDDSAYVSNYGRLYNLYAVNDNRNICPVGWHVPTKNDWEILANTLGGTTIAGGKLKASGYTYWRLPNTGADNSSGFNALPAGFIHPNDGKCYNMGYFARFWGTAPFSLFYLRHDTQDLAIGTVIAPAYDGCSIRCIKD